MSLHLEVNIGAGTHGENACKDMVELATKLGIVVMSDFNDVHIIAHPETNYSDLWRSLDHQLTSDNGYKFATEGHGRLLAAAQQ